MKTLQEMIKDLTNIIVEQEKIDNYLESKKLNLINADLSSANLSNIKITKKN